MRSGRARQPRDPKQVLIAEHDEPTGALMVEVLRDEGLVAHTADRPDRVVDEVRAHEPDLLVVELPSAPAAAGRLLDELRVDPVAAQVPELATSTYPPTADAARASFTVQETTEKPFDLDDFLERVRRALYRPPLHADLPPDAVPEGPRAAAERALAEGSREALLRFAADLRADPAWRERGSARLPELLGEAPTIVEAVDAALHYDEPAEVLTTHPTAAARVRAHAEERQEQGMPREALIREYDLLRSHLQSLLAEALPGNVGEEEVLAVARLVDDVLDQIQASSLPAADAAEPSVAVADAAESAVPGADSA